MEMIRDIWELHPIVEAMAQELIDACNERGLKLGISETYRTVERQDYLYSLGRTRPGNIVTYAQGSQMSSYHQWRLALDIFQNIPGKLYEDWFIDEVALIAEEIGFEWGGRWTGFTDRAHLQYTGGLSISDLKAGKTLTDKVDWKIEGMYELGKIISVDIDYWSPKINESMPTWACVTFASRILIAMNEKIGSIFSFNNPETEDYRKQGLQFLIDNGVIGKEYLSDSVLDDPMAVSDFLRLLKTVHVFIDTCNYDLERAGLDYFCGVGEFIDYDYWKIRLDQHIETWAVFIMLRKLYDLE